MSERQAVVGERSSCGRNGRRTVGLLVDWLKDGYQNLVFAGVADGARELDVNLLCFAGGIVDSPHRFGQYRNVIYRLAGPHNIDGLVVMSGTLGNHVGPSQLARYCAQYNPLPMVSVAVPVQGMPTVMVDDAEGMRDAVRHLTDVHSYKRIAFVRGPEENEEAQRRFAAYREVLSERGLPFDPGLVCPGNFQAEAGAEAVRVMLDERKVTFDAVIAANDHMALGAMHALQERGLRVPEKVAVIGFDDVDEARFTTPPLTTVRQPLYEQGRRALALVLDRLRGERQPSEVQLSTDLVIRESCGCSSGRVQFLEREVTAAVEGTIEEWLAEHKHAVGRAMNMAIRGAGAAATPGWEGILLDAFRDDLMGRSRSRFTARLEEVLRPVVAAGTDVGTWHAVVTTMRRLLVPVLLSDPDKWLDAEDLWQGARVLIADTAERAQARQRLHVDRWARTLSQTSEALLATVHTTTLVKTVAEQLPHFGIESCFLSLFDAPDPAAPPPARRAPGTPAAAAEPPAQAKLMLAYDAARGGVERTADLRPFRARDLMPPDQWPERRRWTFIVEPLTSEAQQFGLALFEMGPREGIIYESLREQISSGLNSARLVEQVVLEATRRQVAERRRLEQEMELAARIQTSILPRDLTVDGLEIAATMQPASEVGGDYYDVFAVNDGCWIGVGDVAGHGLSTGLVMLMIQSGFGTIGRQNPHLKPSQLLPFLNDVIYDNVRQRLSHDEHATLTLLRYHRDGVITFAGAHEDIVVLRKRTGECEIIPTPGPWLGARRNVSAAAVDSTLRLEDGDLIVLYTDGIIEAASAARKQFGVSGLCTELLRVQDQPVVAIRDHLMASVRGWMSQQDDDMTILVGRYHAP